MKLNEAFLSFDYYCELIIPAYYHVVSSRFHVEDRLIVRAGDVSLLLLLLSLQASPKKNDGA